MSNSETETKIIRLLRLKHRLTTTELSESIGVSQARYSRIELQADYFALENGKYGKAIINNSRTKIVLPLEEDEAMYVKKIIGLSDEETLQIIRNRQGEGLLCAGHNRISVAFHATDMEYRNISSSRQDLEKQSAEGKNNAT